MKNIKKRCHKCDTPLTVNPRAASVPGELCRECFEVESTKIYCKLCKVEVQSMLVTPDSTDDDIHKIPLCKACYTKVVTPTLKSMSIKGEKIS